MFKLLSLVATCLLASTGCDQQTGGSTAQPIAAGGEAPKAGQTTPISADTPAAGNEKWVTIKGKIVWDTSKPDGSPRKLMDSSRIFALGWRPQVDLRTGLKLAYEDFCRRKD